MMPEQEKWDIALFDSCPRLKSQSVLLLIFAMLPFSYVPLFDAPRTARRNRGVRGTLQGVESPGKEGTAMPTIPLSGAAQALLRLCYSGAHVPVDDGNWAAYRELAAYGLMTPLHTFANGRESAYRMTEAGVSAASSLHPSPATAPAPHGSWAAASGRLSALLRGFRIRPRPVRAR